jgi:hypothetical protein
MPRIALDFEITVEELANQISQSCNREEISELIQELDRLEADYEFTEELRNYFVAEIAKEDSIVKQ